MENDEEYEHLPNEFYYPEECLDENSDELSVQASRTTEGKEGILKVFIKKSRKVPILYNTRRI